MKIALLGYGKMGKAIEKIALQHEHEIVLRVNQENISTLSSELISNADLAFEFSRPDAAFENVVKCFDAKVPVVCGTTGWNEKLEEAKKICHQKRGAFFYASNFSIGVNVFFELNKRLAQLMAHFSEYNQVWINETHHIEKKDYPSGTAITLAEEILHHIKRLEEWKNFYPGKEMSDLDEKENEPFFLPINSIRLADAVGMHEVNYESDDDSIKISHHAKNRNGFAKGALLAAEWLKDKQGVFGMKDLLRL